MDFCVFVPKKKLGPLANRCATCGLHKDEHRNCDHDARAPNSSKIQDLSHMNLQVVSTTTVVPPKLSTVAGRKYHRT